VPEVIEAVQQYRDAGADTFNPVTRTEGDVEQLQRLARR
jgi:hypothetical protein